MPLERRDVFHRDDLWSRLIDKSSELIQEPPPFGALHRVAMGVCGERLARRATSKDANGGITEPRLQFASRQVGDVALHKGCPPVVGFIWEAARWINIDARSNGNTSRQEAVSEATSAAEQVDACSIASPIVQWLVNQPER